MKILYITLLLYLFTSTLHAVDSQLGKQLHQKNCIACHAAMTGGDGSVLYTRKDRRVTTINTLEEQVHRCQSSLGLNWTAEQLQHVKQYLNDSFYHY